MKNSTSTVMNQAVKYLLQGPNPAVKPPGSPLVNGDLQTWGTLLGWLFIHQLGRMVDSSPHAAELSRSWMDEWWFGKLTAAALQELGLEENSAWKAVMVIKVVTGHGGLCPVAAGKITNLYPLLQSWLSDGELQRFIGVNRYQGILWFNQESFNNLLWWMYTASAIEILAESQDQPEVLAPRLGDCYARVQQIQRAENASGYQVEKLLEAMKGSLTG